MFCQCSMIRRSFLGLHVSDLLRVFCIMPHSLFPVAFSIRKMFDSLNVKSARMPHSSPKGAFSCNNALLRWAAFHRSCYFTSLSVFASSRFVRHREVVEILLIYF